MRGAHRRRGRRRPDRRRAVRPRRRRPGACAPAPRCCCARPSARPTPSASPRGWPQQGLHGIDAPMSGGPARARDGSMSLMVACADAVFGRWRAADRIAVEPGVPRRRTGRRRRAHQAGQQPAGRHQPGRGGRGVGAGRARRAGPEAHAGGDRASSGQSWIGIRPDAPRAGRRLGAARPHHAAAQGHRTRARHGGAGRHRVAGWAARPQRSSRRPARPGSRRSTTPACSSCYAARGRPSVGWSSGRRGEPKRSVNRAPGPKRCACLVAQSGAVAQVGVLQRDLRAMLQRDLRTIARPRPAAVDVGAQRAVERLEHLLALGRGDARAGVLDLQHHHLAERVVDDAHRDRAAGRRVLQRVVDQVADQLAQQHARARHQRTRRRWRLGRCSGPS